MSVITDDSSKISFIEDEDAHSPQEKDITSYLLKLDL